MLLHYAEINFATHSIIFILQIDRKDHNTHDTCMIIYSILSDRQTGLCVSRYLNVGNFSLH